MPNLKSAVKKVRQDKRKTVVNFRWRQRIRAAVKAFRREPGRANLIAAQRELDKAAKKGVIKKGKAARLKSRLSSYARNT